MDRELLNPSGVHLPQAHYSHVACVAQTLYISGQLAMDHAGAVVGVGDAKAQARQCYANLAAILAIAAGVSAT
jgi:enamine deaminase RidA (YjgF/YER057c/UK114 family)